MAYFEHAGSRPPHDTLNEAIAKHGAPEIMNADQGSQCILFIKTDRLRRSGVRTPKYGKVRILDKNLRGPVVVLDQV